MDVTDYAPFKSGKGYTMKRQLVYDPEDSNRGVVWKNVLFKVNQILQYYAQGAGVQGSYGGMSSKKKKDRKVYLDGLQLVTALPRLQQLAPNYTSGNGGEFIEAFLSTVKGVRDEMVQDGKKLVAHGDIVFDALCFLFERGTPVSYLDTDSGCVFGTIVTNWLYAKGFGLSFNVTGSIMKSDGQNFYQESVNTSIPAFSGLVKIDTLPIQQLNRQVHTALTARGKSFAEIAIGAHFKQYTGVLLTPTAFGYMKFRATGRVMIDTATFNRMNPNSTTFVSAQATLLRQQQQNQLLYQQQQQQGTAAAAGTKELKESQYWMTYPTLPGFSLFLKKWGEFLIEGLSDIVFDDLSFVQLVLPEDKKRMIKALVEEHQLYGGGGEAYKHNQKKKGDGGDKELVPRYHSDLNNLRKQPDLISQKGGGCIFLLHGSPGVGKTLTAEAVSEHLHIPLYQVTVGELGTEPLQLEKSLSNLLELAALWNASLLLDEADIFLERRSRNDILRNAMVGIFLRLLEYHQGVLFLTTNRVDCLDDAFSSRISVALYYPPLDKNARIEVWKNFLLASPHRNAQKASRAKSKRREKRSQTSSDRTAAEEEQFDFEELSKFHLNGRQIRSCVQMARALANSEGKMLAQIHLVQTVELSLEFNEQFRNMQKILAKNDEDSADDL